MLGAAGDVDRIRSLVARVDESPCSSRIGAGQATGIARSGACSRRPIHRLKGCYPAVLREVTVEHAEACAEHGVETVPGRIRNPDAGSERAVVIVRGRY